MQKLLKQKNKSGGFTLVETLVGLLIFSFSVIAMMSVLGNGIADTRHAQQKIVAGYLAQEGIEYARNVRDTYVLYSTFPPGNTWDDFRSIDNGPNSIINLPLSEEEDATFDRIVIMTERHPDYVTVVSTVQWQSGSGPQEIIFSENLYNWVE